MTELIGYFEAKPAVRSAGPATFQDATVATLAPLTVTINGATEAVSAIGFAKVVGERGLVMVQGTRVEWFGGQDSPAIIQGEIDTVTQGLTDFQQDYTADQAAAAVELGNIRDAVDVLELEAVTTTRLAVLATGDGLYLDGRFQDSELRGQRATNTGMTDFTASGIRGSVERVFLTAWGTDEGVTIPLTPDELYSVRVWGTGFPAYRDLAIKHSNGVITPLPTQYPGDGLAATVVPSSPGARLLVRRVTPSAAAVTITRVEIRHGIGGTLIEEDSINTTHITTDAIKARHVDTSEVYADLKITSPTIETNTATDRGIKIIDDTLTGYSSTGEKLIEIGGPNGLIKGVRIEGSAFETDPAANRGTKVDDLGIVLYSPTGDVQASLSPNRVFIPRIDFASKVSISGAGSNQIKFDAEGIYPEGDAEMDFGLDGLSVTTHFPVTNTGPGGGVVNGYRDCIFTVNASGLHWGSENPDGVVTSYNLAGTEYTDIRTGVRLVRQGRVRELLVDLTATYGVGTTGPLFAAGVLPPGDRPKHGTRRGIAYFESELTGYAYVTTAGSLYVVNKTGATRSAASANISWTV